MALEYHKPIIAYSADATRIEHFPHGVERTGDLSRVEEFLAPFCGRIPPY
jgi:hypothetical protein